MRCSGNTAAAMLVERVHATLLHATKMIAGVLTIDSLCCSYSYHCAVNKAVSEQNAMHLLG
jgi:hypothetical protein